MSEPTPNNRLDPRTLAKLRGLKLRAQHIVEGYVAGLHRSPYQGYSIEFAEHREYAPGDDLRYLDWKVFGRTDKLYLKRFEDETNLICYIVLDCSESMMYKSDPESLSKFEYAQCVAASLAWLVLQQQDAVGFASFDDQITGFSPPSGSSASMQQLLQLMDAAPVRGKTRSGPIFHELAQRFSKRGVIIILSDLFDDVDTMMAGLKHFRHRRHDVVVLHTLDPAELSFPFEQPTLFKGLEQFPELRTDPRALRRAYLNEFQDFLKNVERGCRGARIDYRRLPTDQPMDVALSNFLSSRMHSIH